MDRSIPLRERQEPRSQHLTFKTVEQAIQDYLSKKRGTLDANKESTKLAIQKIAGILEPLGPCLKDRGVVHLKDVKTEHLPTF